MNTKSISIIRTSAAGGAMALVLALCNTATAWASSDDFSISDGVYHIQSATDWDWFCDTLTNSACDGFIGKTVYLDDDITVTKMAGNSSAGSFKGTFDGQGHLLTVSYGSSEVPLTDQSAAPFRYTGGDAVIQNLHVGGSIYTQAKYAAGFIGQGEGSSIVISNCVSSVSINSSVNGDGTHAGFVAISNVSSSTRFEGCLFDGKLLGESTNCCGGFVGWRANGGVSFQSCIVAPSEVTIGDSGSQTFCRNLRQGTDPLVRAYFTQRLGTDNADSDQGLLMCRISQGNNATISISGDGTDYDVPGVTFYGSTETGGGLRYGGSIYGGIGEKVRINIGLFAGWGWMLDRYYAQNGTLMGTSNPFVVCPEADGVVVDAELTSNHFGGGNGTEGDPCQIRNEDHLNSLREKVNGGKTYEYVHFLQMNDISCNSSPSYKDPIGTKDHPFMGHYSGGGHTITQLHVNCVSEYTGFFGHIEGRYDDDEACCSFAVVRDINFKNCCVESRSGTKYGGMVVGYCGPCGQVMNCTVSENCTIMDTDLRYGAAGTLGGIVGYTPGEKYSWIRGCRVAGSSICSALVNSGLIGEAGKRAFICDNFVMDLNVHGATTATNDQAALIAHVGDGTVDAETYHDNYYRSNSLPAVYGWAGSDGEAKAWLLSGIPEGVEVDGPVAVNYNGANYFAEGATVNLNTTDISVLIVSGAADYTISEDRHHASITFGSADVNVTFKVLDGACGENATWRITEDEEGNLTHLTISGNGAMTDYDHATDGSSSTWRTTAPWGWDVTSVTIGPDITSIGAYAFTGCENLQRVDIQKTDGLVSLTGDGTFDGCHADLAIVAPTPALALQYMSAPDWSSYADRIRVAFGNQFFAATDEGGTAACAIATADDLMALASAVNAASEGSGLSFRQTASIDLTGINFTPIGNRSLIRFWDSYDGGGHVISGLNIGDTYEYSGLFGLVYGTVQGVVLMNPTVSKGSTYSGTLIGCLEQGSATNCYVYGAADRLIYYTHPSATVTNVSRARKVSLDEGITATPDASDVANGFIYDGVSYYREGIELTLIAPEGYTASFSYTDGKTTTELSGSTLTVPATDITVIAKYTVIEWTGTGSSEDPYIIIYRSQLDMLAERVNSGKGDNFADNGYEDKFFRLDTNIEYRHKAADEEDADTESNFTAIGCKDRSFNGTFDGANHAVTGIRIYKGGTGFGDYYQGLFGRIGSSATVSGVVLDDARITGCQYVGGIVGENHGGTVTDCQVLDSVTVYSVMSMSTCHGGHVGINSSGGTVTECSGAATVTYADGLTYCQSYGGIVGENENSTVTNCTYTGTTVRGTAAVGAIIGYNGGSKSKVENCYYTNMGVTGLDDDINCAVGDNSQAAPDPVDVAPLPVATHQAPMDDEDNDVFIALMARRSAAIRAALPGRDTAVPLTLRGRTLHQDGKWHTICLPFDVDLTNPEGVLYGAEARELTEASITAGTLNLTFSEPVEKLVAGTPYIIRLAEDAEIPTIINPSFAKVDIDATDRSFDNGESAGQRVRFVGSYKMRNYAGTEQGTLLMSGADAPHYPTAGTSSGAFRAYFQIGDDDSQSIPVINSFNIRLGKGDGIIEIQNEKFKIQNEADAWYDLSGRKLGGKPTQKGIYINNGIKVAIK